MFTKIYFELQCFVSKFSFGISNETPPQIDTSVSVSALYRHHVTVEGVIIL